MRKLLIIAAAAASLLSSQAMAWGSYGHRTIGSIAMANVKPETRAAIGRLLAHEAEIDTPQCSMRTIEDAATWPDCIKGERWRWAYQNSWHYHDQPICGTFDMKQLCRDGMCATAQIERDEKLLANRKLAPVLRLEALAFLVHFVGDLHQPLHVGENEDQGGNAVKADYGDAPGRNLHSIWDSTLAERAITSASPPLVRVYSPAEKGRLATGNLEDWTRESYEISRDFLYPLAFGGTLPCDVKEPPRIVWTNAAIEQAIPVVDERIQRAGLRLARMLDKALG
ncbi:S1/P1 nuclease [Novosphingobium panipatense]|uniref:S1/P1 Nuclease n=1 Tax=Novosphingobium panipatense TaxID=428991 RepID=A0ABY1Q7F2_9SPHN|nr:S1/P1 nuclease [Novosphingobium panipatense]SMP61993.1 S1/P1 Nuclease [Novosphingobium panipatense]